ncbi:hypothetical protein I203_107452 [Kwoniella mangroviensis CBS 8507]|uniref:hypothetical protein n=1 Tax=Kwoniella mangroviensis CBS 8507 TaxID=1296122 RepID=UPI00080D449C|nr:uncharacterized protein I203_02205 [Kwoniella mangroviensis CBS 8507]OCF68814.1 hypothetical protein I203_02205 [Kwoniella mangroviensis CBS 8507]
MGRPTPPPRLPSLPSNPRPTHSVSSSTAPPPTTPRTISEAPSTPRRSLPATPRSHVPPRKSGSTSGPSGGGTSYSDLNDSLGLDDIADSAGEGLPAYLEEADENEVTVVEPTGGIEHVSTPQADQDLDQPVQTDEQTQGDNAGRQGGASRFGRWREWVEKRAVERFDSDPDRQARRNVRRQLPEPPQPPSYNDTLPSDYHPFSCSTSSPAQHIRYLSAGAKPTILPNSALLRIDYGRSLEPHSTYSINCAYPVPKSNLVIMGTSHELKVLNTDLMENTTRNIWFNLPVWEIHPLSLSTSSSKGYIIMLVGGAEEISKPTLDSKPKRNSGTQVRIYSLKSLISLAKYSSVQPASYLGIDLSSHKGKEKGKGKSRDKDGVEWTMIDGTSSISSMSQHQSKDDLVKAWSDDYTILHSGKPHQNQSQGDIMLITSFISQSRIFVAVGTSNHVIVHGAFPPVQDHGSQEMLEEQIRFTASRTFYLPCQPQHISFLQLPSLPDLPISPSLSSLPSERGGGASVLDDSASLFSYDDRASIRTGNSNGSSGSNNPPAFNDNDENTENQIPSLGLYVSFGSKACLIRVNDSTVLDLKLKTSSGSTSVIGLGMGGGGGSKGDWGGLETLRLKGGGEVYVITRGKETFLFSAPFDIPSQSNIPLYTVLWPESPFSLSASIEYSTSLTRQSQDQDGGEDVNIRLISTSYTGNLHVQHLDFSTGRSGGGSKVKCKPFGSSVLGNLAKVIMTEQNPQEDQEDPKGKERDGCWVRYRRKEGDWRVIKLERE